MSDDIAELVAMSLLHVTKLFNSMVTAGASNKPDFDKSQLPSVVNPYFARCIDTVPLMLERFARLPGTTNEQIVDSYMKVIAVSMAMGAENSFVPYRAQLEFGFNDGRLEEQAVKALTGSFIIRNMQIPHKLVQSSFSQYKRPKADDPKRDMELQLALRLFLYTTARWYGADQESAMKIYDQHLKVEWVFVMCGMWEKALERMNRPQGRARF